MLLRIGAFINTLVSFAIMAFAVFLVVRMMDHLAKKAGVVTPASRPADERMCWRENFFSSAH